MYHLSYVGRREERREESRRRDEDYRLSMAWGRHMDAECTI